MLVLTPKYGSQIDLDLLKKQKEQKINHRLSLDLTQCKNIKEAYLSFLDNKDKYIIGYKPKDAEEINDFVHSLCKIDTLDVSWIDVSELKMLCACFKLCCRIKHIVGLEKWNVNNVTDMSYMFEYCDDLESIDDISGWDVSNVKYVLCMFSDCENLESIGDISGWDVRSINTFNEMFSNCKKLESIGDISGWDVINDSSLRKMFSGCENLKNVGNLERWNIKRDHIYDNTWFMFDNSGITHLPSWYTK